MSDRRPIRVGDVVRLHDMNVTWAVTAIRGATLTIETDVDDEQGIRTERRSAQRADCVLVGEQLAMEL